MSSLRIVFMGTPAFAVVSLRALVDGGFDVAAVVTSPDRPAGRGQQLRISAVKEFALGHPLLKDRILQPERLKDPSFHAALDATGASLYVVVAFRMLPEAVWNRPVKGTINLHASLLPDYRGAAPINWAIINGEKRTGVTTFFIRHEIDSGDILDRTETTIGPDETAGELHDRLMEIGASLLRQTVLSVLASERKATPQTALSTGAMHHAPKLTPANCRIDPNLTAERVHDMIRGLSPFPGAWGTLCLGDAPAQHFKILRSAVLDGAAYAKAGTIGMESGSLILHCGAGRLRLLEVQAEGKRRMDGASLARGWKNIEGAMLT